MGAIRKELDMKQLLKLKNMSCQNCVKHVTKYLLDLEGVEEVHIHLKEGLAEVETSVVYGLERYQEVLKETIYDVEELV